MVLHCMLTPEWINGNKAILLEVDVDLNEKNCNAGGFLIDEGNGYIPTEYRYLENIEPEKIRVVKKLYLNL